MASAILWLGSDAPGPGETLKTVASRPVFPVFQRLASAETLAYNTASIRSGIALIVGGAVSSVGRAGDS